MTTAPDTPTPPKLKNPKDVKKKTPKAIPAPKPTDILTTQQAARILGLSTTTVQKMVASGELDAWVTSGGHRRIFRSALDSKIQLRTDTDTGPRELRVLLAEDDAIQAAYFETLLKRCRHPVLLTVATDASQALIQIERQRPDVVVTDLMMQPFDGYHLIKTLSAEPAYRAIELVVVTAKTPEEAVADGELPDWITLYQKPVQAERLLGYIDALASRVSRSRQDKTT
jgi:excisionase family DNA binding protein